MSRFDAADYLRSKAEEHAPEPEEFQGNPEALIEYWRDGPGADRIGWGTEGDFRRCMALVGEHIPDSAAGFCQNRHIEIYGVPNATRDAKAEKAALAERVELHNKNHEPPGTKEGGRFTEGEDGPGRAREGIERGTDAEIRRVRNKVKARIREAKKNPPKDEKIQKNCAAIARSNAEGKRPGGEFRGNAASRRARAKKLFDDFKEPGQNYVICHISGIKMHYSRDPELNPDGLPVLSQGKLYTGPQGGGYTSDNLVPELLSANQSRGAKPVIKSKDCRSL